MSIRHSQEFLFIGPKNPHQDHSSENVNIIERVQNYDINIEPLLISESNISKRNDTYYPANQNVSLSFSYLLTNGLNERNFGLHMNGAFDFMPSGFFCKLENSSPNIFIGSIGNGKDGLRRNEATKIIGLGNCRINNYSISASVGNIINATVDFSALNASSFSGITGFGLPSVNLQNGNLDTGYLFYVPSGDLYSYGLLDADANDANTINYFGPKDIVLTFPTGMGLFEKEKDEFGFCIQSFSLAASFNRSSVKRLGHVYPYDYLEYPLDIKLSVSLYASEFEYLVLKDFAMLNKSFNPTIIFKKKCENYVGLRFDCKGAKLTNFSSSNSVNSRKEVNLEFSIIINNPFDQNCNLFATAYQGEESYILDNTYTITGYDINGNLYFDTISTYKTIILENLQ